MVQERLVKAGWLVNIPLPPGHVNAARRWVWPISNAVRITERNNAASLDIALNRAGPIANGKRTNTSLPMPIRQWNDRGKDVFVYSNSDVDGHKINNARKRIDAVAR